MFWILYSRYNRVEDVLNELKSGSDGDNEVAPTLPMPNRVSKLELGPMFKTFEYEAWNEAVMIVTSDECIDAVSAAEILVRTSGFLMITPFCYVSKE